jgi:hypothetical protein
MPENSVRTAMASENMAYCSIVCTLARMIFAAANATPEKPKIIPLRKFGDFSTLVKNFDKLGPPADSFL